MSKRKGDEARKVNRRTGSGKKSNQTIRKTLQQEAGDMNDKEKE